MIVVVDGFLEEIESLGMPFYFVLPLRSWEFVACLHHYPHKITAEFLADHLHQSQRHKIQFHVNVDGNRGLALPNSSRSVLHTQILKYNLHVVFVQFGLEVIFLAKFRFVMHRLAVHENSIVMVQPVVSHPLEYGLPH